MKLDSGWSCFCSMFSFFTVCVFRTFTHNMLAFGLSKKLCNDFLKKQAVIGNLNEGQAPLVLHYVFFYFFTWPSSVYHLFLHRSGLWLSHCMLCVFSTRATADHYFSNYLYYFIFIYSFYFYFSTCRAIPAAERTYWEDGGGVSWRSALVSFQFDVTSVFMWSSAEKCHLQPAGIWAILY